MHMLLESSHSNVLPLPCLLLLHSPSTQTRSLFGRFFIIPSRTSLLLLLLLLLLLCINVHG
jgi:hypothetical protein